MAQSMKYSGKGIVLVLSEAEAKALHTLASDGAEGILTDPDSARGYIGGPASVAAADRALAALKEATNSLGGSGR